MEGQDQLHDLMSQIGNFGWYQFKQHCLHSLAWFTSAIHMMSFVFVFPVLDHRCYVDEIDGIDEDDEFGNSSDSFTKIDGTNDKFGNSDSFTGIDLYIPKNLKGSWDSCHRYGESNETIIPCDDGYVYNSSYFTSSRITDFDMVCEKDWMRAVLQTIFLVGTLFGAFSCGIVADKYGRKPIFCISGLLQFVFGVLGVFLNNYVALAVTMFFYGLFGASGAIVTSVALTMEVVGGPQRNICGTMFTVSFGIGAVVVATWAYFLPIEAHVLQLIFALHSVLLFAHFWVMDESICWLWTNGQKEKAIAIAEKAVKYNGGKFENRYSVNAQGKNSENTNSQNSPKTDSATNNNEDPSSNVSNCSALDLFRYPVLRRRTMVMLYCWFASSLTYFGLSFNSVNLFGNPFVMFIINILVELPGHAISVFLVPMTGNKPMFSFTLFFTGVSCTVVGLLSGGMISNIITMTAKVAATIAFNIINSYTAELFPTCLRNTAIGICIMAARTGASIIPEINLLSAAAEQIPTITFGTVGVLAGLFAFFLLPETLRKAIPQTIEDVERPPKTEASKRLGSVAV